MTLSQAVKKLRGKPGTKVHITVLRESEYKLHECVETWVKNAAKELRGGHWTPEEFTSYAESLPEDTYALYGVSQMDLFEGAVMPSMDAFVDWDKRECSFNSAYFESLLVWAGKYGEKEKEEKYDTKFS